jgi:hypothetical protein
MQCEESKMTTGLRIRFWIEVSVGIAAVVTMAMPDWFEVAFGLAPDGGDGSFEWAVVAGLAAVAATCLALAWSDARRLARA